jgi:hypothetical protein
LFLKKNTKMGLGTLVLLSIFFFETSEVDQELECEMHQNEYKVMIGCNMDWPP